MNVFFSPYFYVNYLVDWGGILCNAKLWYIKSHRNHYQIIEQEFVCLKSIFQQEGRISFWLFDYSYDEVKIMVAIFSIFIRRSKLSYERIN